MIQDFDFNANLLKAILWQYNDAEYLKTIIENKQNCYNSKVVDFFDDWYTNVFNIDTANDFGLSVWAKILNVNFAQKKAFRADKTTFGFGNLRSTFARGNFIPLPDEDIYLTTEQKRLIIKIIYQKYNLLPSVPEINKVIRQFFGESSYVVDGLDMTTSMVVFTEQLSREKQFIIEEFGILPRPAGVGIKTKTITGREWGFGSLRSNFNSNSFFGKNT
jgi:hypothetical protein